MKRRMLSIILTLAMVLSLLPVTAAAEGGFGGGSGTPEEPYLISTAEQLREFAEQVNDEGRTTLCATLTADIDLSEICGEGTGDWTPI